MIIFSTKFTGVVVFCSFSEIMSSTIKGAFYVPPHKKPFRKTEGWDCQHCFDPDPISKSFKLKTRIRNEEKSI